MGFIAEQLQWHHKQAFVELLQVVKFALRNGRNAIVVNFGYYIWSGGNGEYATFATTVNFVFILQYYGFSTLGVYCKSCHTFSLFEHDTSGKSSGFLIPASREKIIFRACG